MPADPPQSLLITPDRRRRLQQQYDEARQLANQPRADFRRIHDLLTACLQADPGNILYLDALLANLKRREATESGRWRIWKWFESWRTRRVEETQKAVEAEDCSTKHSVLSPQHQVLQDAPVTLWNESNSIVRLHQLAIAAGECDFDEVELRYLAAAREAAPDDPETLRLVARALTRQGRFEDASGPWFAVLALAPGDAEAEQAIEDLRGASDTSQPHAAQVTPTDAASLLQQARENQNAGRFESAEHLFAQAQAALGGDLALWEEREQSRLLRSEQRVRIARSRAEHDSHPKAKSLVTRLEEEHNRLDIDILNIRAERLPADVPVRIDLARRLKRAGNYSGAIQRLEEALKLNPADAAALVELGESWQHLRQFHKALEYYQQAVTAAEATAPLAEEALQLSRYRAAVLAASLGQLELAKHQFEAIVAVDSRYKDAEARLQAISLTGGSTSL